MSNLPEMKDDVYFGGIESPLPDWRKLKGGDEDADDELLEKTPADVKEILGFDPLELNQ